LIFAGVEDFRAILIAEVGALAIDLGRVMRVEEAALLQTFGDEYEEYSREVKRLIPRVY